MYDGFHGANWLTTNKVLLRTDHHANRGASPPTRLALALLASCVMHLLLLASARLGSNVEAAPEQAVVAEPLTLSFAPARKAAPQIEANTHLPQPETATPAKQGAEMLPVPAVRFYGTRELTKRPQPLGRADLDAPEIRMIVASGKMVLKLWIDASGEVIEVEIEKTELPDRLAELTKARFRDLRFTPGERMGVPVGSVMRIEVDYDDNRAPPR